MMLSTPVCSLKSPLNFCGFIFCRPTGKHDMKCLCRAGSESHSIQDSFSLLSPRFLGSSCECSPQTMLLDNEPVSLTLKPVLAALGNLRGGGGGWERRRLGGSWAGFLGGDLSHPFHIEKHFSARGGEKCCLSVPVPSAPIGLPVFA